MGNKYKNFMKDFCFDFLERYEESKNYQNPFDNGVHFQLWATLTYIKNRAEVFGLDQEYLGIDSFNSEDELANTKGLPNKND